MSIEFNNLKIYRRESGLTQEQVAEKLNVSRQAVAKWENGDTLPDIEAALPWRTFTAPPWISWCGICPRTTQTTMAKSTYSVFRR